MHKQRTIKNSVRCVGIGLHTGKKVSLVISPAPVDTGIVFTRSDIKNSPLIKASVENVVDTLHATTIGVGKVKISTIEHLMASFVGLGIDNAFVEVDAPEIPIMDGSAAPFVFLLKSGGVKVQNASKKFMVIRKTVRVEDGESYAEIKPSKELKVSCSLGFDHPLLKDQSLVMVFSDKVFDREISRARTFGFLRDVEYLRSHGLVKGGSLDNAVVMDDFKVLNEDGLRYKDEFVRHKILDAIGDMAVFGMPLIGKLDLCKAGHRLHYMLAKKVLDNPRNWKMVELAEKDVENGLIKVPQFNLLKPSIS